MIRLGLAILAGFVVGAVGVGALTLPRLHRHLTAKVALADLEQSLGLRADAEAASATPLICWGDSLTAGAGTSPGHDFPSILRNVFRRPAINRGVSGETSAQIKARLLGSGDRDLPANAIIWAGRNDDLQKPDETLRNIADMVGALAPGSRYLVLGVLNSDTARERRGGDGYGAIVALNRKLAAFYGAHYVPIREILVAAADAASVDDQAAVGADVVPPSLRSDALHLDDEGEAFVASAIEAAIRRGGW